ncbi:MAG: EAL domain-containing protein [Burkholderiales bacterium]|nr:EAL domain-containing protein [Burkholderiales bacterium]
MADLTSFDSAERKLRKLRLVQYGTTVFIAFLMTAVNHWYQNRFDVAWTLAAGALMMPVGLWLSTYRSSYAASVLMLVAVVGTLSVIMWRSDGLHDSALLSFPVILVGAAQLFKPRHFLAVMLLILLIVLFIGAGTVLGWRSMLVPSTELDRLIDSLAILTAGGYITWLLTHDLQRAQGRLRQQIRTLRASEKDLKFLAQHDSLTRLPNRVLGSELIELAMASNQRRKVQVAVLFVDLDNFKDINDSLGHAAGDSFLKEVAMRLLTAVRVSDVVCRQGGDEFLIGLTDMDSSEDISQVANNVLQQMQMPFSLRDTEIRASCSIGIAVYPKDGATFEELLRHADLAMYQAKESGRNAYRFYDEDVNVSIQENLHLISSLRAAIKQNEFVLHYQPVIKLSTGALVGAEALVRWQNPKLGLVAPGLFIPTAEKSGLIVDLGQWVIEEACRQMQTWRNAGAPPLTMAVNLSPVQFRRGGVEAVIERALKISGLDPACLEVEVTESILLQDTEQFIQALQRLKAMGIRISIDDFGTGYSNLSYLQRFAVDKLKIDQSFVKRLANGPQDTAIVNAIIHMAKSLQLTTTAEGVEDETTRARLSAMDCDLAQGYLFARPLTAEQFAAYMQAHAGTPQ